MIYSVNLVVQEITSFKSLRVNDSNVMCIFPILGSEEGDIRNCKNSALESLELRRKAIKLYENVDSDSDDTAVSNAMMQLLIGCFCSHHQGNISSELIQALCSRWHKELVKIREEENMHATSHLPEVSSKEFETDPAVVKIDFAHLSRTQQHEEALKQDLNSGTSLTVKSTVTTTTVTEIPMHDSVKTELNHINPKTIESYLRMPLSDTDFKPGFVYVCSLDGIPDLTKVGSSRATTSKRDQYKEKECGTVFRPIYSSPDRFTGSLRVEQLVHAQFRGLRRSSQEPCPTSTCTTHHRKHFNANPAEMTTVAQAWSRWMIEARPYGEDGVLKRQWEDVLNNMIKQNQVPIAASLLAIWEARGKVMTEETTPTTDADRASPEAGTLHPESIISDKVETRYELDSQAPQPISDRDMGNESTFLSEFSGIEETGMEQPATTPQNESGSPKPKSPFNKMKTIVIDKVYTPAKRGTRKSLAKAGNYLVKTFDDKTDGDTQPGLDSSEAATGISGALPFRPARPASARHSMDTVTQQVKIDVHVQSTVTAVAS